MIKEFFKPTKFKITITLIVIFLLIVNQAAAIQLLPEKSIFLTVHTFIFTPVDLIRNIMTSITGESFRAINGFILDILTYYFLGCLIDYIIKLFKEKLKH